jgi:hypothetical protein
MENSMIEDDLSRFRKLTVDSYKKCSPATRTSSNQRIGYEPVDRWRGAGGAEVVIIPEYWPFGFQTFEGSTEIAEPVQADVCRLPIERLKAPYLSRLGRFVSEVNAAVCIIPTCLSPPMAAFLENAPK